ncbi:hypothetical protein IMZ11_41150 [Microtetraspora sp. AC03309]|uniref:DUF6879 family protein n=1 Tax=Microtetraspora sp. AC03309 TaxID=2779376 RepID=UPI001E4F7B87|nr:DUF6879 family protein [Microtetraspora sp. AC03309]MCC5582026.1 hypothetical protein [Microtetraspora sp. AC03309]
MTPALSPDELIRSCERSAIHLEMRDGYMLEDPGLVAWQSGRLEETASCYQPWMTLMQETVRRGVDVRRARIVSEPLSEYVRFEYEISHFNVAAGEQVRWLARSNASDLALPGNDFWLIDETWLVFTHFSGNGDVVGREQTRDPQLVKFCLEAFDAVWERATPHDQYRPA